MKAHKIGVIVEYAEDVSIFKDDESLKNCLVCHLEDPNMNLDDMKYL